MVSTPEMVDSVNAFILTERGFIMRDVSEQWDIFVDTAHKIVHELIFLQSFFVEFHQINARLHTANERAVETMSDFGWAQLLQPSYCLD